MFKFLVDFFWWLMQFIGVYHDLPRVPDASIEASLGTPNKPSTPLSRDKHVTFSPQRDIIPDYGFDGVDSVHPVAEQIRRELASVELVGSEQV